MYCVYSSTEHKMLEYTAYTTYSLLFYLQNGLCELSPTQTIASTFYSLIHKIRNPTYFSSQHISNKEQFL